MRGKSFIHSQQSRSNRQAIHNTRNSLEFVAFVAVTLAANRNHNNLWAYSQSKRSIFVGRVPACQRQRVCVCAGALGCNRFTLATTIGRKTCSKDVFWLAKAAKWLNSYWASWPFGGEQSIFDVFLCHTMYRNRHEPGQSTTECSHCMYQRVWICAKWRIIYYLCHDIDVAQKFWNF